MAIRALLLFTSMQIHQHVAQRCPLEVVRWEAKQTHFPGCPFLERQHAMSSDAAKFEHILQQERG